MTLRHLAVALWLPLAACAGKPESTAETKTPSAPAAAAPATSGDTSLLRADKARIQGSDSAKVWFVMSSDFQCPFCRSFHKEVWPRIEKEYVATGKLRVAFLNHPMSFHQFAIPAAEAAMCAGRQDRFWPMHDKLFEAQDAWAKGGRAAAVFDSLAGTLGIRMEEWRACTSSHATRAMVEADFARSSAGGVTGTPSFFIGDQLAVVGAEPYAAFRQAIEAALAKAGGR
ncbi:MAG TPA: thioredoxin domain-containing protein [Gemmatimonadaceae bacterium]|nr:thioredoxin domain-containing protein [Gemmatimonadaceae bacterium]